MSFDAGGSRPPLEDPGAPRRPVPEEAPPRRIGRMLFWVLFAGMVLAAAWLLFWPRAGIDLEPVKPRAQSERPTMALATRSVVLYFGDSRGESQVAERREVPAGSTLEKRLEAILGALADGPDQRGALGTLPRAARVRRVFYDDETNTAYLDFTPELVTEHPGGSAAEYHTLSSIVRTLGANFPEVQRLQILVDGEPIASLAGHFDISQPIVIATWR